MTLALILSAVGTLGALFYIGRLIWLAGYEQGRLEIQIYEKRRELNDLIKKI